MMIYNNNICKNIKYYEIEFRKISFNGAIFLKFLGLEQLPLIHAICDEFFVQFTKILLAFTHINH